jgi:hypothetical protein
VSERLDFLAFSLRRPILVFYTVAITTVALLTLALIRLIILCFEGIRVEEEKFHITGGRGFH